MLQSPTTSSWLKVSPLEVLISRACDPSLQEPNYALHLEVAEYINNKKANTPREAAMTIARLANHRNPHIAILALALVDTLVQSCGYPFHLQISTKEFLNELVRRFPERPPPFPGPVMSRILDLIHGWKEGICMESRWKEDLGNIRDMYRLLTFKGYRFRDVAKTTNTVAVATANLKTAEELEEEDRVAQSAKLQELIRRGTPRDLAAAQELMKSLAGADPDAKPDYRSQALTELNKLEQKVILLNEMLENVDMERGEKFVSGDAYDQVSSILIAARPKLQKWISDAETDDPESLDTFLQINDQINTVLTRYEAFKKGDYSVARNPIPQELAGSSSAGGGLSLIDFDDVLSEPGPTASSTSALPTNDLSGLFSPGPQQPPTQPGAIRIGMGLGIPSQPTTSVSLQQHQQHLPSQPLAPTPIFANGGFSGSSMSSLQQQISHTATPPASIKLPATPGSQRGTPVPAAAGAQASGYFGQAAPVGGGVGMAHMAAQSTFGGSPLGNNPPLPQSQFSGFGGTPAQQMGMGMGMGASGFVAQQKQQQQQPSSYGFGVALQSQQQQQQQQPQASTGKQQSKDPFADLAGLF